jgi:hypothetical protein
MLKNKPPIGVNAVLIEKKESICYIRPKYKMDFESWLLMNRQEQDKNNIKQFPTGS